MEDSLGKKVQSQEMVKLSGRCSPPAPAKQGPSEANIVARGTMRFTCIIRDSFGAFENSYFPGGGFMGPS